MASKYGKKSQSKVQKVMEERKAGTLRSGSTGRKVTSRKQAIAIGLSEARRAGGKVPPAPKRKAKKKYLVWAGKSRGRFPLSPAGALSCGRAGRRARR